MFCRSVIRILSECDKCSDGMGLVLCRSEIIVRSECNKCSVGV